MSDFRHYHEVTARFPGLATCGGTGDHPIKPGDRIGYRPPLLREGKAQTICRTCWETWKAYPELTQAELEAPEEGEACALTRAN